ncbi:MAG: extracellular solute-binding protein [Melioribacteraceae bacterium]|nr:extracellular solute-binding protein [Melioribacteraceae bacterium]
MNRLFAKKKNFISISVIAVILMILSFYIISDYSYKFKSDKIAEVYYANYFGENEFKVIDKFNKQYEGQIKVIPINFDFDIFTTNERKELFTRALRSKSDRIDIFAIDYIWTGRFARWAEPLSNSFSTVEREKIINYAMDACYYDNKLVAIPLQIDIGVLCYRKDMIERLENSDEIMYKLKNSITWEDFIKLGSELNDEDKFYFFPADSYEGLICGYFELILNQNRDFFNEDKLDFERDEAKKALELLVDLVNSYKYTPSAVTSVEENACLKMYSENDGFFLRTWPSFRKNLLHHEKSRKNIDNYFAAPLPHFEGTRPAYVFGGWNLMVSKYSKNKSASLKFIKFLLEEENQLFLLNNASSLPVIKELYNSENEKLKFYKSVFKDGVLRPFWEDYTRISDIVSHFAKLAIDKEITVNHALKKMNQYIRNNKMIIH